MPAADLCEPQVIRAFDKAGWDVVNQPFSILVDPQRWSYVYADLRLRQRSKKRNIIVVEVKCFGGSQTFMEAFYQAIGQYMAYRVALRKLKTYPTISCNPSTCVSRDPRAPIGERHNPRVR